MNLIHTAATAVFVALCLLLSGHVGSDAVSSCLILPAAAAASASGGPYNPAPFSVKSNAAAHRGKVSLAHITFGSNNRQGSSQAYWEDIVARVIESQPGESLSSPRTQTDMLLWAGNAVFADISRSGVEMVGPRTPEKITAEYSTLTDNPLYRDFIAARVRDGNVAGVWDEHDMGLRHGVDKNYAQSREVRQIYLDSILGGRHEIKQQLDQHEGLYYMTRLPAPPGSLMAEVYDNAVCVVALDVVSLRSPYANFQETLMQPFHAIRRNEHTQPKTLRDIGADTDILGEAQWAWLEGIVKDYLAPQSSHKTSDGRGGAVKESCAVTLFVSAWQVLLNDNKPFTGWDLFPAARTRLLAMLRNYEVSRFLFVSGHADMAELGGIMANPDRVVEEKMNKGYMGLYARSFPITPLTQASRDLLPVAGDPGKLPATAADDDDDDNEDAGDAVADEKGKTGGDKAAATPAGKLHAGLIEVTSAGLTHSVADAPLVGRITRWLFGAEAPTHMGRYQPAELARLSRVQLLGEGGGSLTGVGLLRYMSRYLVVGRETRVERNFGTLQLLVPASHARRDAAAGGGAPADLPTDAAAVKALVDRSVRVSVGLHHVKDGTTMLRYDSALEDLPSYRQPAAAATPDAKEFIDYMDRPAFSIYNLPGEYPSLKRNVLSIGCPEVPCVHGRFFMFAKMAYIAGIAFLVLLAIMGTLVGLKLYQMHREEQAEAAELLRVKKSL